MPHGHCLLWRNDLLFMHVGGDILTTLAYLVIPTALVYLVHRRQEMRFDWMTLMFAAFILLCGITHAISILNVWHGYYFVEGIAKVMTGLISITTAFLIWKLMPQALSIPSQLELLTANEALQLTKEELQQANETLEHRVKERTAQLEELASIDALTSLLNRRTLMQALDAEMERFNRYGHAFSLLLIDLDHFKQINDTFGHLAGDAVLIDAAVKLTEALREPDIVGRYGGEEFLVILPQTSAEQAMQLAQRIRASMNDSKVESFGDTVAYTCSIGVTTASSGVQQTEMLHNADTAMYKAKQAGRNAVSQHI